MDWYIDTARYYSGKYYVDGQEMPYCSKSGSKRDLHATSLIGYVSALGGTGLFYVTTSVLATFQASNEWETIKPNIRGVVPNTYAKKYDRGGDFPYCWELIEGITPAPLPSDSLGEITSIDIPASAMEGDSVDLCATIKNTGSMTGKFFLRFYDGSTMVRETLPGNVAPGQTIEDICELFTMPDHAWSGKIELMRQG